MTGSADPPGSSYVVVSDSATGSTWRKIPTDAYADLSVTAGKFAAGAVVSHLGYTPFNRAGDTIVKNTGAVDSGLYTRTGLTLNTSDTSRPALTFSRDGTGAAALLFESGTTLKVVDNAGNLVTLLTSASAVDAATLDGHDSGNAANNIPISNGSVCMSLNADTVDGIHGTNVVQLNSGGVQTMTLPGSGVQLRFGDGGAGHDLTLSGALLVTGSKTRGATGHDGAQFGVFHAFETPDPFFADLGRARLADGVAVVPIAPDLANYLDLSEYDVYLVAHGPAALYADPDEMTPDRFIVRAKEGDPDVGFSWWLVARQGDMTHIERQLPVLH